MKKRILGLLVLLGLVSLGVYAQEMMSETMSETMQVTTVPVKTLGENAMVVEGASATLVTSEHGLFGTMETMGLEDGHVYTFWVGIFNNPEACAASPCTAADMTGNNDGVQGNLTWGDSILYSGEDGRMTFTAHVAAGDITEPWYDYGLTNPTGAEIHLVINDHGEFIPDMAASMLNTYRGGCTDESLPPPFPDSAKSDGEPGPNACTLIQVAIITQ
jgi:hypothetical protein